ncbi:VOC family protein [Asanoa sp. NPDC050611]|uniref:VOC family protein n=1 Tax=Asanoa sp. NPDC050611 TaxID=3157098 RepID=UPI0033F90E43
MSIRTSYPHGTPNWLELHTDDHTAAMAFYGGLFGWRFDALESDAYARAYVSDAVVAAISTPDHAGPSAWLGYLAVDDVDAAVRAVGDAGGRVTVPPHDRADRGRAALITDPTEAPVGLWQAHRQPGAALVGEPATMAWFELLTDDTDAASAFYQQALGLVPHTAELDGIAWTTLHVGDDAVAGVVGKRVTGSPNRWNLYFATDDIVATTRRAADLGATITADPVITAIGPMAGVRDPSGAHFSLWAPIPPGQ